MSFQCNFFLLFFLLRESYERTVSPPMRDALLSAIVVLTEFVRLRARNKRAVALLRLSISVERLRDIRCREKEERGERHTTMWMLIRRQIFETLSYTRTPRPVGFSPRITRSGFLCQRDLSSWAAHGEWVSGTRYAVTNRKCPEGYMGGRGGFTSSWIFDALFESNL